MMERPLYSIVISFYNEESQAAFVIKRLLEYLTAKNVDFELILVNNGSQDGTEKTITAFAQNDPRVRTTSLVDNTGFGGGMLTGLKLARGKYIGFTTAGGQVLPEHLLKAFDTARQNPQAVVKAKRLSRESLFRELASYGYAVLANLLFFVGILDINGHPLVLAKEVFDSFAIQSKNFMINLEILTKAKKRRLNIITVPIPYSQRAGGRSHVRLSTAWLFFKQLIELRKNSLFTK